MNIKDKVIEHAATCRAAWERGEAQPLWKGGVLRGVDLQGANLSAVVLSGVDMIGTDLRRADFRHAVLRTTLLCDADLRGADLRGADLRAVSLTGADLRDADLRGATLSGALDAADLSGAMLPDGRTLAEWQADPLAGLCDDPETVARALAAWEGRTWEDCPLHAALGVTGFYDMPEDRRMLAETFVALLDGGHLPRPPDRNL